LRNYEFAIIIEPRDDIVQATKTKVKEYIESYGGSIIKEEDMGIRTLGYEISKNTQGYYHIITVEMDPSKILDLENEFRINEQILKFMTVVLSK
jgi:small subunit ribosomal protein S6